MDLHLHRVAIQHLTHKHWVLIPNEKSVRVRTFTEMMLRHFSSEYTSPVLELNNSVDWLVGHSGLRRKIFGSHESELHWI